MICVRPYDDVYQRGFILFVMLVEHFLCHNQVAKAIYVKMYSFFDVHSSKDYQLYLLSLILVSIVMVENRTLITVVL